MNDTTGRHDELWSLLEALGEQRLTAEEAARLERIVLRDREARRVYLNYIDLHGTLHWDTAQGAGTDRAWEADGGDRPAGIAALPGRVATRADAPAAVLMRTKPARRRLWWSLGSVAAALTVCAVVAVALWSPWNIRAVRSPAEQGPRGPVVAERAPDRPPVLPAGNDDSDRRRPRSDGRPIRLAAVDRSPAVAASDAASATAPGVEPTQSADAPATAAPLPSGSTTQAVVALIDDQLRAGWKVAGVQPSPRADDAEWMRRVYLDLIGRIPSVEEAEAFLADRSPDKRARLVDELLDRPDYVRNWSTIWTNLLIGRSDERGVDRFALKRFLRRGFAENRPWNEVVYDLVSAEGDSRENGAANFLLAHLNNEAVPATAITARVFMGIQVQCTQCHNHPFNDWKQDQFWTLNSFFQQTELVRFEEPDAAAGQPSLHTKLISRETGGPIYYETRRGLMKAAYPQFEGVEIDPSGSVNRRRELARLMTDGGQPNIAAALVNRLWAHFFGHGFTRPIDDMGPHNPPSHPELLDRLAEAFVRSGYDRKQLIRWIVLSDAYQLTSRFGETNQADDPLAGESPLFSRVYVKPMTAEQVYDSLLVATKAHQAGQSSWEDVARQRQEWLQQFVIAFGNEENGEADLFQGSISQALMRMNGDLVDTALSTRGGTFFGEVLAERIGERETIRKLCLAALSREPTDREMALMRKLLRERIAADRGPRTPARQVALREQGLQDVFWAYLNSAEFVLIH